MEKIATPLSQRQQIKEAFLQLAGADSTQMRDTLLRQLQTEDPQLADEVRALLKASEAGNVIEQICGLVPNPLLARTDISEEGPSHEAVARSLAGIGEKPGTVLGPYKLLEQIGEGGMGTVFHAQQSKPIRRKVALKIIKPGMDTGQVVARFEAERQALALMDHPNIAKVLDAGATEQGRPYFVMELVKGIPITDYCNREKLDTDRRLKLFIDVCHGVQHAHQKGIIHRDLKPSNILITLHDGKPVVKIIDFGIAKAIDQELTERTLFTQMSQMIGTPLYMSPEQAEVSGLDIDTRSDVYSLGVLLYELLTGTTPFDRESMKKVGIDEIRRMIRETEPPRPSQRFSTLKAGAVATSGSTQSRDLKRSQLELQGELDWIVMKALEKERNRRYESASAFAADVERYLSDEPVQACPPTLTYQLQKFTKRNRGLLTTASLLLVTMIGGTAVSLWYAAKASEAAEHAKAAQTDAEEHADNANNLAIKAELAAKETLKSNVRENAQRQRAEQALYLSDVRLAASHIESGSHSEAFDSLLRQYPKDAETDFRSWEWYYLLDQENQSLLSWQAHESYIASIDWSPDGKRIATASGDGSAAIWDAETGGEVHRFLDGATLKNGVNWHPKSHQLAFGSASNESVVRIWNEESDTVEILDANTGSVWNVSWNHDGSRMAVGAIPEGDAKLNRDYRNFVIWSRVDGQWRIHARTKIPFNITSTVWNFDDSLVAVACEGGYVDIYESETLKLVHQTPHTDLRTAHWHPSRNLLAFGTRAGECVIFNAEEFTEQTRFSAHNSDLRHVQWSDNGERLASCGVDGFVKIWNTGDWSLTNTFSGHSGIVKEVSWHPDSERIASAGFDGVVNIWRVTHRKQHFELDSPAVEMGNHFAWTTDDLIRTISGPASVVDRDPRTGKIERTIDLLNASRSWGLRGRNVALSAHKEGAQTKLDLLTIDAKNDVTEVIPGIRFEGEFGPNCISQDSTKIALSLGWDARTIVFDLTTETERRLGAENFIAVKQMVWAPDGKVIAIVGGGVESDDGGPKYAGWLHLVDPASGADISHTRVGRHRELGSAVAWSPDSQRIVVATRDGTCEIFDSQRQRRLVSRQIHRAGVTSLSWHPDGARIASAGDDQTVKIWDSMSGETILILPVNDAVSHVEWSPDGKMLAAQEKSGTIRIWDTTAGSEFADSKSFQACVTRRVLNDFQSACEAEDFPLATQHGMMLLDREGDWGAVYYYRLAVLLAAEHDNRNVDVCVQMLKRFTGSEQSIETYFTAWTCALAPNSLNDYTDAIALGRAAVDAEPTNPQFLNGLGAILMRAGMYAEAKPFLEETVGSPGDENTSKTYTHYFLAMTEHHLGNAEDARTHLKTANDLADKELLGSIPWNRKLTIELLRTEAQTLIGDIGQ